MASQQNHIDRTFREKLKNFSDTAPPEVWEGVYGFLDQNRKKNRLFIVTRIAASVAVIIALGSAYLLLRNPYRINKQAREVINTFSDTVKITEPLANDHQVLLSETAKTSNERQSSETNDKTGDHSAIADNTIQQTSSKDEVQLSMLSQVVLPEEAGEQTGQLTAAAGMELLQGVRSGPVGASGSDIERINTLREMIAYETVIPAENTADDFFVLIDENTEAEATRSDKWAVGTQVSPVYSYRDLGGSADKAGALSYYNNAESGMLAYVGGLNLAYLPAERLTVQSGVYYSRMGISVDHSYVSANLGPDNAYEKAFKYNTIANSSGLIATGAGNIEPYFTSGWSEDRQEWNDAIVGETYNQLNMQFNESDVIQNFEYLEVPVILKYKVIDRRLGFNILGGMSTNFLIGSNAFLVSEGNRERIGRTEHLKTFNYSSTVGMGMDYELSSRFNLSFEPFFKYYLNSINQTTVIKSRPYTFGIFSGISFVF